MTLILYNIDMCSITIVIFTTGFEYYTSISRVTFSAGETQKFIPFTARNDSVFEFFESLTIHAQLSDNRGSCKTRVTIVDNSKLNIFHYSQG